jgi:ubiquinone/menaquinone biosynthesis C-methylase UbiE
VSAIPDSTPIAVRYDAVLVPAMFVPLAGVMADAVEAAAGDRVLDAACGSGALTRVLAERAGAEHVVGVDISDAMLEVARGNVAGARFVQAPADQLPFADGDFTVVTCQQGLQFMPDPAAVAAEFRRLLAPGGRTAIACWCDLPNNAGFRSLVEAAERHMAPEVAELLRTPFRMSDPARLRELLGDAGFDEVVVEIERVEARFPLPPARYGDAVMVAGPAAPAYLAEPQERRDAFVRDVAERVQRYADGDGVVFEMPSLIAIGRV